MELSLEGRLEKSASGSYSHPNIQRQNRNPYDPYLRYLQRAKIPVLSESKRAEAELCIPREEPTDVGDAVIALIGKMHAKGVILKRFEEERPHDVIRRNTPATYFACYDDKIVLLRPEDFVRVDAAYIEKYFGVAPKNKEERYLLLSYELFSDLAGVNGRFVDPTPSEHYQTAERARRAEIYLHAFREACTDKAFAVPYEELLSRTAFPQFNPIYTELAKRVK